jgi:hypothetical protein
MYGTNGTNGTYGGNAESICRGRSTCPDRPSATRLGATTESCLCAAQPIRSDRPRWMLVESES